MASKGARFRDDLEHEARCQLILDAAFYPALSRNGVVRVQPNGQLRPGTCCHKLQTVAHIDIMVESSKMGSVGIEEKLVRWKGRHYTAITIETHSDYERERVEIGEIIGKGWIATSWADFLLWGFEQENRRSLRVWLFHFRELRDWFIPRAESFVLTDTPNAAGYKTRCRVVPLGDIPNRAVYRRDLYVGHGQPALLLEGVGAPPEACSEDRDSFFR